MNNRFGFLIDPEEVLAFSRQRDVKILDIRKAGEYARGHLQGAIHVERGWLESQAYPYRSMMLEKDRLEALLSALGLTADDRLLITDGRSGYDSARLWWLLAVYGFHRCHIVNGGIDSLKHRGIPLTKETLDLPKASFRFQDEAKPQLLADLQDVTGRDEKTILLDVRSSDEYTGLVRVEGARKSGRIPGARHIPYDRAIGEDHTILPLGQLKELYGHLAGQSVIVYCQAGYRSAFTLMVLQEVLGYGNIRNYDGSWIEYSYFDENPIISEGYDTIIIGGGSAGLSCAAKAAREGMTVALVEESRQLGGECLLHGCVPSKTLLRAAAEGYDFAQVKEEIRRVQAEIGKKDDRERFEAMGVEVFTAAGKIQGSDRVVLDNQSILKGRHLIIAAGTSPFVPAFENRASVPVYTNETIFQMEALPDNLLIIGGGAIGCELGYGFALLGCQVTIVEQKEHILPEMDGEIAAYFQNEAEPYMKVVCNSELTFVDENKVAQIHLSSTGEAIGCRADAILLAAGRRPNTKRLGPDILSLLNSRGYFDTDEFMRTREKRIFAAGDITGKKQLSHGAAAEAEVIIGYLAGRRNPIRYDEIPTLIYTKPQVYQIGFSEAELRAQKRTFMTVTAAMEESDRFVCDKSRGLIKAFVDPNTEKLLGIGAAGPYAGEWMQVCSMLYSLELPISAYLQTITPYPSYTGALEMLFKKVRREVWSRKQSGAGLRPLKDAELDRIKLFVLDMDGTIYLGDKLLPGTRDFIAAAKERGKEIVFFTNNSSKSSEAYIRKLAKLGLTVKPGQLMTSGDVTIAYLKNQHPGKNVCLLGTKELEKSFREAGISVTEREADLVVVGFDTTLTYEKLHLACNYIREGKPYFMTHPDYNCPVENGFMPDCGAFGEAIASSTGRRPVILGKPYEPTIEMILKKTGYSREEIAFVGDRLYTDIAAGINHGCLGILVLSGETKLDDLLNTTLIPHGVYEDIGRIFPDAL